MPYCSIFDEVGSCRRWLPDRGRWCKNSANMCGAPIEKISDTEASRMKILAMNRSDSQLPQKLLDLATDVHCARWHKTEGQICATAYHWLKQLQESPSNIPDRNSLPAAHLTSEPQVQPRYSTRSATSRVNTSFDSPQRHGALSSPFPARRPRFSTLPNAPEGPSAVDRLVHQAVRNSLGVGEWRRGRIYIFTRASDPGFVKIGYTWNVSRRLREWQRSCGYSPILLYQSENIAHVHRAERLIFAELGMRRRIDMRCANEPSSSCERRHNEWFEIDIETAIQVATFWTEWITNSPYDNFGNLCPTEAVYTDRWLEHRLKGTRPCRPFGSPLPRQMNLGIGIPRGETQPADTPNPELPRTITAVITTDYGSSIKLIIEGVEYRAAGRENDMTFNNRGSGRLAQEPHIQSNPIVVTLSGPSNLGLSTDHSQMTQQPRSHAETRRESSQLSSTPLTTSNSESTSTPSSTRRSRSTAPAADSPTAHSSPAEPSSRNLRTRSTTHSPHPRPASPGPANPENECDICLDPLGLFHSTATARPTTCPQCRSSHWHSECISLWLRQASSCPLCRGRWTLPESAGENPSRTGNENDESSVT